MERDAVRTVPLPGTDCWTSDRRNFSELNFQRPALASWAWAVVVTTRTNSISSRRRRSRSPRRTFWRHSSYFFTNTKQEFICLFLANPYVSNAPHNYTFRATLYDRAQFTVQFVKLFLAAHRRQHHPAPPGDVPTLVGIFIVTLLRRVPIIVHLGYPSELIALFFLLFAPTPPKSL